MNTYQEADQDPRTPAITSLHPVWILAVVLTTVTLMGVGILMGGGWLGAIKPPVTQRIFLGEGTDTAECPGEFQVADSWELRWEHDGDLQEICWTNAQGVTECYASLHRKPIRRHGSVNVSHGGTFKLKVTGQGRWKLEVYAL